MSNAQIDHLIGGIMLLLGFLEFLGVDAALLRQRAAKINLRKWVIAVLFMGGLTFTSFGFYRASQQPKPQIIPAQTDVNEQNIESKVREWLDAFNLGTRLIPNNKAYFDFEVSAEPSNPLQMSIVRSHDHPHYLTILTTGVLTDDDKSVYNKLSESQKTEFQLELGAEFSKARISAIVDPSLLSVTVFRRVPITTSLTEATFIEQAREVEFATIAVNDTIELGLIRRGKPMPQLSPTPSKATSQP